MKKSEKKQLRAPKRNVELTDQRSERWIDKSDFIDPLFIETNIQGKLDLILSSEYLADHCEVILSFSAMTKPNHFATLMTYWWDIRLLRIVQSDKSRAPWRTTQELEFYQIQNFVWEVKYHKDPCTMLFSLRDIKWQSFKKYEICPILRPILPMSRFILRNWTLILQCDHLWAPWVITQEF